MIKRSVFNHGKFEAITVILGLFILTSLLPNISADVVSQNAGGTNEIIILSNPYIEGFFSGAEGAVPVCGNSIIETGETCDDGGTVSGDGCSATCQTEATGGGGGGGTPTINLSVIPSEFNVDIPVGAEIEKIIQIKNFGTATQTLTITQQELDGKVEFGTTSLSITPGETINLQVTFIAGNETGFFTGRIFVNSQEVLVALNVHSELLLFDSNIIVLNKDYKVERGSPLRTLVTLIPLGDVERMDVTLNYVIKDYSGKVFLTKSETLLIDQQVGLGKEFDTGALPLGDYIVGLELIYPNGVAPSSAHFEIVEEGSVGGIVTKIILYLVSLILIVLILIVSVLIWRRLNEGKEVQEEQ